MVIRTTLPRDTSPKIDEQVFDTLGKSLDLTPSALILFKEVAQSMLDKKNKCNMVILENGSGGYLYASFKDGKFDSAEGTPSTGPEIPNMRSIFESAVKAKGTKGIEVRGDDTLLGPRAVIVQECAP